MPGDSSKRGEIHRSPLLPAGGPSLRRSAPRIIHPSVEVVIGEALIDELNTLIQHAAAAGEVQCVNADLFGISGIITFVEFMSTPELRSDCIPDQFEQFDSIMSRHAGTAVVPIDQRAEIRVHQIFAAGCRYERSAS